MEELGGGGFAADANLNRITGGGAGNPNGKTYRHSGTNNTVIVTPNAYGTGGTLIVYSNSLFDGRLTSEGGAGEPSPVNNEYAGGGGSGGGSINVFSQEILKFPTYSVIGGIGNGKDPSKGKGKGRSSAGDGSFSIGTIASGVYNPVTF